MALEGFSLLLSYDAVFISSNIYFYELKLLAALLLCCKTLAYPPDVSWLARKRLTRAIQSQYLWQTPIC